MKKLTALWLSLLLAFGTLTGCAGQIGIIGGEDEPTAIITSDSTSAVSVTEDGQYDSKDEVSAYLTEYGHLPSNYITKKQAHALGWQGGSLEPYAPGCSIGGDRFGNYEGSLPQEKGRTWTECDIGYDGGYRGGERIVFSNDGLIYYTADHYATFDEVEVDDSGMLDDGFEQEASLEQELGALFDWLFGE